MCRYIFVYMEEDGPKEETIHVIMYMYTCEYVYTCLGCGGAKSDCSKDCRRTPNAHIRRVKTHTHTYTFCIKSQDTHTHIYILYDTYEESRLQTHEAKTADIRLHTYEKQRLQTYAECTHTPKWSYTYLVRKDASICKFVHVCVCCGRWSHTERMQT